MLPFAVESLSLGTGEGPKHRRLYTALRRAILDGSLSPEFRLPPARLLAKRLGVSQNTGVTAFEQLRAEGYVTAKAGLKTALRTA